MKTKPLPALAILVFFCLPAFAQKKPPAAPRKDSWALVMNFENLVSSLSAYSDGYQTGAGIKHWFTDKIAGRGLLGVLVEPYDDTSSTTLGLSCAVEMHPRKGPISPYFGGLLGATFLFEPDQNYVDLCGGALGGVEVRIFQNLAIYAEYQGLLVDDYYGLWFRLGQSATLGLLIYF